MIIEFLKETGGIETRSRQRIYKICREILDQGKRDNVFLNPGSVRLGPGDRKRIDAAKKRADDFWNEIQKEPMSFEAAKGLIMARRKQLGNAKGAE